MKRFIALLLAVVIAATALSITAFAVYRSGVFKGKTWTLTHNVTGGNTGDATTYFLYPSGNDISISQKTFYYYHNNPNVLYSNTEFDMTSGGCAFCFYPLNFPYVIQRSVASCSIIKGGANICVETAYP